MKRIEFLKAAIAAPFAFAGGLLGIKEAMPKVHRLFRRKTDPYQDVYERIDNDIFVIPANKQSVSLGIPYVKENGFEIGIVRFERNTNGKSDIKTIYDQRYMVDWTIDNANS